MRASVQRLLKNITPDGEMDAFELATYTLQCILSYSLSELSLSKLKRTVPSLQREDAVEEAEVRRKMDENGWMFRGC